MLLNITFSIVSVCLALFPNEESTTFAQGFELIETWDHSEMLLGGVVGPRLIEPGGRLLLVSTGDPYQLVDREKVTVFRPFGKGPGDLDHSMCFAVHKGGIVVLEVYGRFKFFIPEGLGYQYHSQILFEPSANFFVPNDIHFAAGKWFLSGQARLTKDSKPSHQVHIKVLNEKGTFIKWLVESPLLFNSDGSAKLTQFMTYYLTAGIEVLYFIADDFSDLVVIDPNAVAETKRVQLARPSGFQAVPDSAYARSETLENRDKSMFKLAEWHTSYSRIVKMVAIPGYLVIQCRNLLNPDQGRFHLLFYKLGSFELTHQYLTGDLLLTHENGVFYFLKNGIPGEDDDAGELIVDLRRWRGPAR